MLTILRQNTSDGIVYEIDDFAQYLDALGRQGIEPPHVAYRIFVSRENERSIRDAMGEQWEDQIELLFKLGPAAGIPSRIVDASHRIPPQSD
ncbi:MAG: hypothetical protein IID44_24280 [Planctomycetes bacterium]|nr:hypothetical protein [Planctomycetota bacterium]